MRERVVNLPARRRDRGRDSLLVREATPRDATAYLAHMRTIVAETTYMLQSPADALPDTAEQRAMIDHIGHSTNSLCLVATRGRIVVGRPRLLGSLTLLGGRTARTRHFCHLGMGVIRDAWGRGVGGLMLDAALTWARRNPILTRVALQVFDTNEPARRLYESRGFGDEGVLVREVIVDGACADLIGMSVDVSAR